jgi:hypothetical protein
MENGPGIVFEGQKNQGVDGSPRGRIGNKFTHSGISMVNELGIVLEGHKA